jgi:hypothetical protein
MDAQAAIALLHAKLAAVCPIDGVSIGDPLDRATWRIDFSANATPQQIAAAQTFIAGVTLADLRANVIAASDFLGRFTVAEQTALWAGLAARPAILGQLILWIAGGRVDLTGSSVKTRMDQLVSFGIITAARETAILTP